MDEAVELGKLLHDTPDLFPWVCLGIILIVCCAQHKRILGYFDTRIDAWRAKEKSDAVMAELVRNNTAALNNNTAALNAVKNDRGATRALIDYHEKVSKERIDAVMCEINHVQTVANRIDETVQSNAKGIQIVEDRTK